MIFLAGRGGGGGYRGGYQDYGPPAYVEGKPSQVWSELHVQLLQAIHTQTWYVGAENYRKCWGWLGSNCTSLEDFFGCDLKNLGCFLELKVMATLRSSSKQTKKQKQNLRERERLLILRLPLISVHFCIILKFIVKFRHLV